MKEGTLLLAGVTDIGIKEIIQERKHHY